MCHPSRGCLRGGTGASHHPHQHPALAQHGRDGHRQETDRNPATSRRLSPRPRGKGRIRLCSTTLMPLRGKWLCHGAGERCWVVRSQHRAVPRVTLTHPAVGRTVTGKCAEGLQHPTPLPHHPTPKTSRDGTASSVGCHPSAERRQRVNTRQKSGGLGQSGRRAVEAA